MFGRSCVGNVSQQITAIRTATKRVSGSKTNKNDSAGRRLGPKAYEGHFVKPGEIIMRQRGTKIHPGENTGIGTDHTIYAKEPGYVRFYYDPFHPLRKYVGVALKKELSLPTPHFQPRVRRFGYEQLHDPAEAAQEEAHMSKKEFDAQPFLQQLKKQKEQHREAIIANIKSDLGSGQYGFQFNDAQLELVENRLAEIILLMEVGTPLEDAKIQATFNHLYKLKLQKATLGELYDEQVAAYRELATEVDLKVDVDAQGRLCPHLSPEAKQAKQDEIRTELSKYARKLLNKEDRETIKKLITSAGVFDRTQQQRLTTTYLPDVLPYDVEGSVVPIEDPENPPKDLVVQQVYDEKNRVVKTIGRPKDVFA
ncbi:50S ribosomal protein L27 [Kocuria palustris]|nr:50S ribosomal protein L27 [Kocuria palustris]